jgi:hypothetical protein
VNAPLLARPALRVVSDAEALAARVEMARRAHPAGKTRPMSAERIAGYAGTAREDSDLFAEQANNVHASTDLLPDGPVKDRERALAYALERLADLRRQHARELDDIAASYAAVSS